MAKVELTRLFILATKDTRAVFVRLSGDYYDADNG